MSRLSEILGVKEGQEFRFEDDIQVYRINKNKRQYLYSGCWNDCTSEINLSKMIAHPELIHPLPEKPNLTEQQITAIKGRIAEGTPWAAKDNEGNMTKFFIHEPHFSKKYEMFMDEESMKISPLDCYSSSSFNSIYDFITDINSPVYLPDLIEGSEK